jgi:hypothetical protein
MAKVPRMMDIITKCHIVGKAIETFLTPPQAFFHCFVKAVM